MASYKRVEYNWEYEYMQLKTKGERCLNKLKINNMHHLFSER